MEDEWPVLAGDAQLVGDVGAAGGEDNVLGHVCELPSLAPLVQGVPADLKEPVGSREAVVDGTELVTHREGFATVVADEVL